MAETVLLVDDDPGFRAAYRKLLGGEGYSVLEAGTVAEAEALFRARAPRLVVLDLMLPPSGRPDAGATLCGKLLATSPSAKVVVVSGTGETALSLSLVRGGAYDFIAKPVDPDVLLMVLRRAEARLGLEDRVASLEASLSGEPVGPRLLGVSEAFVEARRLAERAAPTDVPILLTGATGTGKEVFAGFLHAKSRRAGGPFVAVNCGALPAGLLESTLFGHRKGAFTGAVKDEPGLFVAAGGGTLFLDEIGDMDPALQVTLLRALESGEVRPVGAAATVKVDVRVVSATHQPLEQKIAAGSFREDLYWRIRGIEIPLPRLGDRIGDLPLLAQHFLNQARALVPGSARASLSPAVLRRLEAYDWPGNLRELRHEMQRALVMAAGRGEIEEDDLSPALRAPARAATDGAAAAVGAAAAGAAASPGAPPTLESAIAALEHREIVAALAASGGNRSHAAQRLGLSRQGLLNKIARHGIR
jgi:DNA-binding NtrC family response regulator